LKSRVRNYGRMPEQRIVANLRVGYSTASDKLQGISKAIEAIVRAQPNARFERCHFKTIGDSALEFELSYFIQQPGINSLLDLQQSVNFRIVEEFHAQGIDFAYPTQRVVLQQPA
jgi:small-conductance mechanosensitive channel